MTATIFALATAPGKAGVAVLRVSGPRACEVFTRLGGRAPEPRMASLRALTDGPGGEPIDRALVLWFPAPASFTGEDIAELHLHGSSAVIHELITILSRMEGFRMAEPGEFARRAFENGKMDLTQAEGLADLIDAETATQKRQALRQMDGELARLYDGWREQLITLLAHLEAYIDFPDEDLPVELQDSLEKNVRKLMDELASHLADRRGEKLRDGIYIAIVGAPNAGKSSLINLLAKRDISIVSTEAGTTRDAIETHLDISGFSITLCDTAGLRDGAGDIEVEGILRARRRAEQADILLCVFDSQTALDDATVALVDDRAIIVANKSDIFSDHPIDIANSISVSALTGQGIPDLLSAIGKRALELAGTSETPTLTRARHRVALTNCHAALERFTLAKNRPIELRAEDIREAAQALGNITGRIRLDELMDKIFSSFCLGK